MSRVVSVNVSPGGVPKHAVLQARLGTQGVEDDVQLDRRHHGGPGRAVSLFSLEVIEALRAEGHPIAPGTTGENLTISGLDWRAIVPGVVLSIGDAVLEVTNYADPCKTIRRSFVDERFVRISEKLHPGQSRVYARVVREAVVKAGDPVAVEPRRT